MAYVRKVRTATGAVAVQVARKDGGRVVILEHVGSAHTDAELGILLERARRVVDGLMEVLDFEVSRRVAQIAEVPDWRPAEAASRPVLAAPGRTAATSSRLLYSVLGAVYDWLGFGVVDDAVFRDLVIARIVEPTSKADARRVLGDLGATVMSYKTIQRHLALIDTGGCRDTIAQRCFAHASQPWWVEPAALQRDNSVFRG